MRRHRRPRGGRWIARPTAALVAALLGLSAPLVGHHGHAASRPGGPAPRPAAQMAAPTRQDRILVLVPHSDDESAGCGGLIAEAVEAGAAVHVVYTTNGDAFRVAAQRLFFENSVPPQDYRRLARLRQEESLAALGKLGVRRDQVIFLGYPDRGTDQMWLRHWQPDDPYRSPYTKQDHNAYADSLRPGAPYSGRALLDDLETTIRQFRPTIIMSAHPRDIHGDHWALYCYTVGALYEIGLLDQVKVRLYLVHRADKWRGPDGRRLDPSLLPAGTDEIRTRWESLPLTPAAAERKREAILEHHTQLLAMRDYLLNFARGREVFGQVPAQEWPEVGPGRLRVTGKESDWSSIQPAVLAPAENPGAEDRLGLRAARQGDRLFLLLDLAQPLSPGVECRVHLHLLSGRRVEGPQTYSFSVGRTTSGARFRTAARWLEASFPLPRGSSPDGVMLAAETWRGSTRLAHTPWVVLMTARPRRAACLR